MVIDVRCLSWWKLASKFLHFCITWFYPRKVSQAMNEQLTAPFTGDEVLPFSDVPQKGPWPRRLSSPLFFQRRWDLYGYEVSDFSYLLGSFQWGASWGIQTFSGTTPGRSNLSVLMLVSSRGPVVPPKTQKWIIELTRYCGGSHCPGSEPSSFCWW